MTPRSQILGKRLFVLDTNVMIHDPTALFRFAEHDVYLAMMVIEELDQSKKGMNEVARNVRQVSRFIDDIVSRANGVEIEQGLPLTPPINFENGSSAPSGRLFLQTHSLERSLPIDLPGKNPDNHLLAVAMSLQEERKDAQVTLVSKDINLRIKAKALGIHSEDYFNDQVLDDVNLLFSGMTELGEDFWDTHSKAMESWIEEGHTYYRLSGESVKQWHPGQFLYMQGDDPFEAVVRRIENNQAIIEVIRDYREHNAVWGIHARNREQNFALNMLMDPEIDFITLLGMAGTGKTLLTLAAGLELTLEQGMYKEIIMTRETIPVGEDIGFLPGTEEEKMTPWMGALMDNLEVLTHPEDGHDWGRAATQDLLNKRIKIRSLNFMRGRTFLNKFIIIDEAQNLTSKQMKTLITRAGPGTKIICLGNVAQIDSPYLTETTSGLTYVVDRFKDWEHSGHVTLRRGERSRLADYASEIL